MVKPSMSKPIVPITRSNKFFSNEDFDLDISMGREAIEGDGNFTVVLYRVDRQSTQSDDIYNEASTDGIRFYPPVELKVIHVIGDQENKTYNASAGGLRYPQVGPLTFGIYNAQLTDLKVDISYGDYIMFPVDETTQLYYTVTDDGRLNYDNKHMIMGYKQAFRSVKCAPVDGTEFRGV